MISRSHDRRYPSNSNEEFYEGPVEVNYSAFVDKTLDLVQEFYRNHKEIKESHGIEHVETVYNHSCRAVECHDPPLSKKEDMEVKVAALLHDVDDTKYFPLPEGQIQLYKNANEILQKCGIPIECKKEILEMISWVSCSHNGNNVPDSVICNNKWYKLIPRWSDRLEAVGKRGIVRCYQFSVEHNRPMFSTRTPRPKTVDQVWQYATPERFNKYQTRCTRLDDDMLSHYYDKLLHVARPPPEIVNNSYLEKQALECSDPLVQVCLHYGLTGKINLESIEPMMDDESC